MSAHVTQREFARLEGCDEKQVRRALGRGLLVADSEGKLDPAQVGSGWRRPRRDSKAAPARAADISADKKDVRTPQIERHEDETAEDAAARIARATSAPPDMKESLARKEHFNALLRELEYLEKDGALVDLKTAKSALFEAAHAARNEWLQWPANVGPLLAAELGVESDRIVEALTTHVHKQLARLGEPAAEFRKEE